jgi:RNA polymerase sigma-70 factor (ECF subfamily)
VGLPLAVFSISSRTSSSLVSDVTEADQLRARDSLAWSRLFEREHPFVYRAVLAQVGDRTAAEDIAGQVFLDALEGIGRYRDRGVPIRAWLLAISRNRTADWFRKQRYEPDPGEHDLVAPAGPGDELAAALQAMATLTPEQREVMHLRFVEGYQLDEVARLTNRTTGAVKALQHRALERLRALLRDE